MCGREVGGIRDRVSTSNIIEEHVVSRKGILFRVYLYVKIKEEKPFTSYDMRNKFISYVTRRGMKKE